MSVLVGEVPPDWYAHAFTACAAMLPWADDTEGDVERLLQILEPPPESRILDLACGSGSHAFELARCGFGVVGVDISEDLLGIAAAVASDKDLTDPLDLAFLDSDLRDLRYEAEFDFVVNLHGGAVGYFENEAENRRTFETISRSLRPGGRTLMQIPNVLHVESRPQARTWTAGEWAIELRERRWNSEDRYVEGSVVAIVLDDPARLCPVPFRQRLYSVPELFELFASVGMSLEAVLDAAALPCTPTAEQEEIFVVARRD